MILQLTAKLNRHTIMVCLSYALIGIIWILFSDNLLGYVVAADQLTRYQSWKGILFVVVTTLLLFLLMRTKNESLKNVFRRYRRQMQFFRDTFEQAAVGIVHMSKDEEWIRFNREVCAILGYTYQEFKKLTLEDIVHPEDLDKGREMDLELLEGKRNSYVSEKRYIKKSGETIYARLTKSAARDNDGTIKYLIGIIEDITPQKTAERQLEESLEQKQMLLAEIHHRVKNNLAIISGLLELQVYNLEDEQIKQILKESMMRIKSMALIHESYYEKEKLAYVDLDEYLEEFTGYFKNAYYKNDYMIDLQLQTTTVRMNINQAIPCGLLINELLISTYSSLFQQKREFTVMIRTVLDGEYITVEIEDNLTDTIDSLDPDTPSIGNMIIDALLKQLGADLKTEQKSSGHLLNITFRREEKKGSSNAYMNHRP